MRLRTKTCNKERLRSHATLVTYSAGPDEIVDEREGADDEDGGGASHEHAHAVDAARAESSSVADRHPHARTDAHRSSRQKCHLTQEEETQSILD